MILLYTIIHYKFAQRKTERAMKVVSVIGDWYVTKKGTYLTIFGTTQIHIYFQRSSLTNRYHGKWLTRPS